MTVAGSSTASGGFGAFQDPATAAYSEIREKKVDARMRLLAFHEDTRPAYFGTFSKRSGVITGRRPLGRDEELLNYDYDSEGEWEEEEEGLYMFICMYVCMSVSMMRII